MNCRFWAAWTVAKVADLANTRVYELQNAIEFRNPGFRQ